MPIHLLAISLIVACTALSSAFAEEPPDIDPWLRTQSETLLKLYTDLHQNPELSLQEVRTAARMADELKSLGAEVTTGVGGHGVVGVLKNGPGPVVLLRTDMDALPVTERTGLSYASQVKATDSRGREVGVMHACGHDIHMTCFIGTARWLAAHKDRWSGTLLLIAQPAEEVIQGAKAMLADGLYSRFPKPDYALALHCRADGAVGDVYIAPGPILANSTSLDVVIRGRGGHGSAPHTTIDPIVLASLAILDFQTIVSREVNPLDPAVVTVGAIQGGDKHNIISDEVHLQLTLRSYQEDVRLQLIEAVERRVRGLALTHKAPEPTVTVRETTPATANDPTLVDRVRPILQRVLGDEHVLPARPVMGAEDFAHYAQEDIPILMLWLGTIPRERLQEAEAQGQSVPSLHSSLYHPEAASSIAVGVRVMTSAVTSLLPHSAQP